MDELVSSLSYLQKRYVRFEHPIVIQKKENIIQFLKILQKTKRQKAGDFRQRARNLHHSFASFTKKIIIGQTCRREQEATALLSEILCGRCLVKNKDQPWKKGVRSLRWTPCGSARHSFLHGTKGHVSKKKAPFDCDPSNYLSTSRTWSSKVRFISSSIRYARRCE